MWKIFILLASGPFLTASLAANLFGLRVYNRKEKLQYTVEGLVSKFLAVHDEAQLELYFTKRPTWTLPDQQRVILPEKIRDSKLAGDHARALVALGCALLAQREPEGVAWRLKMVRLGHILPTFAVLIAVFTFVLAKLPAMVAIVFVLGTLSASSALLWMSRSIESEAAKLMAKRVENLRILPRLSEEEALIENLHAVSWISLLPGAVLRLLGK